MLECQICGGPGGIRTHDSRIKSPQIYRAAAWAQLRFEFRGLREVAGMTQAELSSNAGIGRVTLVRIENGEQSPRYETLIALSRSLGLPLAEMLADSGS